MISMEKNKISVVVCTRNEENQIQECLEKIKVCNLEIFVLELYGLERPVR